MKTDLQWELVSSGSFGHVFDDQLDRRLPALRPIGRCTRRSASPGHEVVHSRTSVSSPVRCATQASRQDRFHARSPCSPLAEPRADRPDSKSCRLANPIPDFGQSMSLAHAIRTGGWSAPGESKEPDDLVRLWTPQDLVSVRQTLRAIFQGGAA